MFNEGYFLFELEGSGVELIVYSVPVDKLVMSTAFYYPAVIKYHDGVRISDGRQAVGDYKNRTSLHQIVHTFLNQGFCSGINR